VHALAQGMLPCRPGMTKARVSRWPATGLDEVVTDIADVTFLPTLQATICFYDHKEFIAQDCCIVTNG